MKKHKPVCRHRNVYDAGGGRQCLDCPAWQLRPRGRWLTKKSSESLLTSQAGCR